MPPRGPPSLTRRVQLVLPNATVVNVTYEEQPDLFWALRGAGVAANFGIVTHVTYLAVPEEPMLGGVLSFSDDQLDDVLDVLSDLTTGTPSENLDASFYWRYGYEADSDSFVIGVTENYIGANSTEMAPFQRLNERPNTGNTLRVDSQRAHSIDEFEGTPSGNR